MVFEAHARFLIVLHAIAAAVVVGASTHQLLWCGRYLRGRFDRVGAERRFVGLTALAFLTAFLLGSALYPTYKVRVRSEYFDSPQSVFAEAQLRQEAARVRGTPPPTTANSLAWIGRLFDIKEHWVALGAAASLVLLFLSRLAHPAQDRRFLILYWGLSLLVCGTAWTGAIIGLLTASFRSV